MYIICMHTGKYRLMINNNLINIIVTIHILCCLIMPFFAKKKKNFIVKPIDFLFN